MKKSYVFLLIMFVALLVNPLSAELLLTDDFTGEVGTLLTANGWTAHSGAGTTPMSIATPGLTYTGYPGSGIGNRTSASGNGEDVNKPFTSLNSGSVYYSFLINTAMTTTSAGYIAHFNQSSTVFYARFWMRLVGSDINFGLAKTTAAATWDPTNYALNTTYHVVLKYTFNTGSTTDDAVYMWVNPVLGGAEPTPNVSITNDAAGDATSLSAVAIRQYNAGQLAQFDGIRVATTWEDATGTATISAPTVQASAITFANVGQIQMDVNWTNGDGARRIVIINTTNSFTNPVNGTDPVADPVLGGTSEQVVYNGNGNTVTVTGLSPSTTYWFRVYEYNGTGAETMYLTTTATGNPNSQQTAAPAPLITVAPTSLSGFTYVIDNGPSANQTFTVSGINLTNNISIAAPVHYEISLDGTTFSTPLTLAHSGGTVAETTIYVRLMAGLAIASYNGEVIDITSTGATPQTVTLNGSVTVPPPTAAVSLRPAYIDISTATAESAVLMTLSNYPTDDVRYRLYNGSFQYNPWNAATGAYVTSFSYSDGPQALGTPTTSATFWIMTQRGGNLSTAASYRDRLGPTYPSNYQTTALPVAMEITTPFTLSGTYYGSTEYPLTNKYVVLAYSGTTLISAASTALTTGELAVVCPVGTTIDLIEIRDALNNLVEDKTGSWSETANVGGFGTSVGYYDTVIGLEGAALKAGLHDIIRTSHTTQFSYTATTEELKYVDEDPLNSSNIVQIYTGWSIPKTAYGIGDTDWNKEHVWAKSHGDFGDNAPAGTDLHHLRPCDGTVNVAKSNRDFDFGTTPYVDATPYPGYSGDTGCSSSAYIWEPRDADKGDVARMIFYMATRYEGTDTAYDLEVVDYVNTAPAQEPFYGKLSTLLAWHQADPPDAWELRRNDRIQERQGNRNPYIDHPEWVASIWGDTEPANHVTNFTVGTVTTTSIQLTWTDAVAEGYLIKASPVSYAAITAPVDGVVEDTGLFAYIAQGVQTYTFTGLDSNMQFFFKIFPHNLSGDYIDYKTDGTVLRLPEQPKASHLICLRKTLSILLDKPSLQLPTGQPTAAPEPILPLLQRTTSFIPDMNQTPATLPPLCSPALLKMCTALSRPRPPAAYMQQFSSD
jgi:endonuclease I